MSNALLPLLPIKVVNLFAGPGTGKSTTAAGLFNLMKTRGHRVELVTEFAKDLTYEERTGALSNQLYILGKQDNRQRRLVGHCDWIITDSPLPLGLAYLSEEYAEWLPPTVWDAFDRYDNFNVLLTRSEEHPYQTYGRSQTLEQAMVLDNVIDSLFAEACEETSGRSFEVASGWLTPYDIYNFLMEATRDGTH